MRWNRFALWVLCLCFVTSCGKDTVVPTSGAVGHVVGVEGKVTAQRAGEEVRVVNRGDTIFASDAIVTADESNVRILLTHNGATWELGANASERVRKSIAFAAQKNSSSSLGSKDTIDTAAAGRGSNREAGETKATLLQQEKNAQKNEVQESGEESDSVRGEAMPAAIEPPPPISRGASDTSKPRRARAKRSRNPSPAASAAPPAARSAAAAHSDVPLRSAVSKYEDEAAAVALTIEPDPSAETEANKPDRKAKRPQNVRSYVEALIKRCRPKHSAGKGTLNYKLLSGKLTIRASSKNLRPLADCAVKAATNPPPSSAEVSGKLDVR